MNRFPLLAAGMIACGAVAHGQSVPATAAAPANSQQAAVPYLDAHSHVLPGMTPADEVAIFRKAGLAGFVLMDPVADSLKAVRDGNAGYASASISIARLPDMPGLRIGPGVAAAMAKAVDDGVACGFGEIPTRTMPRTEADDAAALLNPYRLEIYREANARGIAVNLHVDIADERVEASIIRIAVENPRARIVLAHTGWSAAPDVIARLMDRFPNVMGDLSVRLDPAGGLRADPLPAGSMPPGAGPVISILQPDGSLQPAWAALIARHPDRFLFAMDLTETERPRHAALLLAAARRGLAPLGLPVEHAVAHGNLERLYAACPARPVPAAAEAGAKPPLPDTGHADALATSLAPAGAPSLRVTSPAFAGGADIPRDNTAYGSNRFPGLGWSAGPKGTMSYAVVVQGELPGGKGRTSIHFVQFNLPASARSLPAGLTAALAGARPGPNVHGLDQPWSGPHTHTKTRQPYHFQVLALDRRLPDRAGQTWAELAAGMTGHVLAAGDLVGWAAQPADVKE